MRENTNRFAAFAIWTGDVSWVASCPSRDAAIEVLQDYTENNSGVEYTFIIETAFFAECFERAEDHAAVPSKAISVGLGHAGQQIARTPYNVASAIHALRQELDDLVGADEAFLAIANAELDADA